MSSPLLVLGGLPVALVGVFAAGAVIAARVPGPAAVVWRGPALSHHQPREPFVEVAYAPPSVAQMVQVARSLDGGPVAVTDPPYLGPQIRSRDGRVQVSMLGGGLYVRVLGADRAPAPGADRAPAPGADRAAAPGADRAAALGQLEQALSSAGLAVRTVPSPDTSPGAGASSSTRLTLASVPSGLQAPGLEGSVSDTAGDATLVVPCYRVRISHQILLPSPAQALASSSAPTHGEPPVATQLSLVEQPPGAAPVSAAGPDTVPPVDAGTGLRGMPLEPGQFLALQWQYVFSNPATGTATTIPAV